MIVRRSIHAVIVFLVGALLSCSRDLNEAVPSGELLSESREKIATSPGNGAQEKSAQRGMIRRIHIGTLYQLREEGRVLLIDVRPAFFFKLGHISGALSLPLKIFDAGFSDIRPQIDAARDAGNLVVLYCANEQCPDSLSTARKLSALGYSSVVYSGGWKEWKDAGF